MNHCYHFSAKQVAAIVLLSLCSAISFASSNTGSPESQQGLSGQALKNGALNDQAIKDQAAHNLWLKNKFSVQHEKLIPIVAVADMFSACNKERKVDPIGYQLKDLVLKMPKSQLAEKLSLCLGENKLQSNAALNFGLLGCFNDQFSHLPAADRQKKLSLVKQAMKSLSRAERQKSFTHCVTKQAIKYLQ